MTELKDYRLKEHRCKFKIDEVTYILKVVL